MEKGSEWRQWTAERKFIKLYPTDTYGVAATDYVKSQGKMVESAVNWNCHICSD